jgi:hypothetical protein
MSKALIWKQDPSVSENGLRLTFLPEKIKDGPRDSQIEIVGLPPVRGDRNGDFIVDPRKNSDAFDAIHTFVIVRQVVTMYQRTLWRIGREKPIAWQWGHSTIKVNPRAGNQPNAYYSRQGQCLKFFFFKRNGKTVFANRSFDVVAHECGHAILDSLRPGYWASWQPETGALHEAFADITAIIALLAQLDQCDSIIAHSKANLHKKTFFSAFAEEFGEALGRGRKGLRSADNDLTMHDVTDEVHDKSQVFTGAFYDILADLFDDLRNPNLRDDADILLRVGEHMADIFLEALLRGPPQNATFKDIVDKMISLEKKTKWKSVIRYHFERRFVIGRSRVKPTSKPIDEIRWGKCHCCLSRREHLNAVEVGIKQGQSCLPFKPSIY